MIGQLIAISFLLDENDKGSYLLKDAIELCSKSNIFCIIYGVQLMTSLAPYVSTEIIEKIIAIQILSSLDNDDLEVRAASLSCLCIIAKYLGTAFIESRVQPILLKLAKSGDNDDQRSVSHELQFIYKFINKDVLLEIIELLMSAVASVRNNVLLYIGDIIANMSESNDKLISYFLAIPDFISTDKEELELKFLAQLPQIMKKDTKHDIYYSMFKHMAYSHFTQVRVEMAKKLHEKNTLPRY